MTQICAWEVRGLSECQLSWESWHLRLSALPGDKMVLVALEGGHFRSYISFLVPSEKGRKLVVVVVFR